MYVVILQEILINLCFPFYYDSFFLFFLVLSVFFVIRLIQATYCFYLLLYCITQQTTATLTHTHLFWAYYILCARTHVLRFSRTRGKHKLKSTLEILHHGRGDR